ncbi:MAG: endonuclease/exonuclease/phosphatase family protein [Nitrospirota bacterium]|nr:endonuclease/exonuclease/phosphatase family protein [Nitrospirota bacterium]
MLSRIGRIRYAVLRYLSRSEWAVRLLGLPRRPPGARPGVVLVQIDGLSRTNLECAIDAGRMPYLKKLLQKEHYRLHTIYAGLPSTTPVFQAELFYGVRQAVPAFSFRDHRTGQVVRMFDPAATARIQTELAGKGSPLLAGGSSYSGIYTGGAAEAHFCPADFGFGNLLRAANPLAVAGVLVWHGMTVIRAGWLVALECLLAVADALRGIIAGRDLLKEIAFVPTRVAIAVVLREAVTAGAQMDAARGLPVIQLNYLGYDEQAHRRGPRSRFAHWSLKGIDRSIRRVARSARLSASRDYQIWVYSDHGQEESLPYQKLTGRPLTEAVFEVLGRTPPPYQTTAPDEEYQRAQWLGQRWGKWLKGAAPPGEEPARKTVLAAMGPVGHLYLPTPPEADHARRLALELVRAAHIPAVLLAEGEAGGRLFTPEGDFPLPAEAHRYLGTDHPFADATGRDLARLAQHPDSGHLVLLGWRRNGIPVTFPIQNGAHGGPGPDEQQAFVLLPADARLPHPARPWLRATHVRRAVRIALGHKQRPRPLERPHHTLGRVRVMTWNVHGCVGMDGHLSPSRIARVIDTMDADVVCLQELDCRRARSGHTDQARLIAELLEMDFHFAPALTVLEEKYGNAVLSRLPMQPVRQGALPGQSTTRGGREPRGAMWVRVQTPAGPLNLINTHLSLFPAERHPQAAALAGREWTKHPDFTAPGVVCGDLNALPGSPAYKHLARHLIDAQKALPGHRPLATLGPVPMGRIDHLFVTGGVTVQEVQVPRSGLARTASDHLPLVVDLDLK